MINNYIILKELGRGNFASVKLVVDEKQKKRFAMKVMNKLKLKKKYLALRKNFMETISLEVAILKKMNHPHCVQLYEFINDEDCNKVYMVLEYVKNGTLQTYIEQKKLRLQDPWKYFRQIIMGLEYLHTVADVIHRDLKPENLLLDENNNIKITDFGVSYIGDNDKQGSSRFKVGSTAGS